MTGNHEEFSLDELRKSVSDYIDDHDVSKDFARQLRILHPEDEEEATDSLYSLGLDPESFDFMVMRDEFREAMKLVDEVCRLYRAEERMEK